MCSCEVVGTLRKAAKIQANSQVGMETIDICSSLPFRFCVAAVPVHRYGNDVFAARAEVR